MENPKIVFVFSGKRKSGKDFVTEKLLERFSKDVATIIRLSGPIKQQYAVDHALSYDELLSSSDYKENYRKDMITWSEGIRQQQPDFFVTKAVEMFNGSKFPVWIVSDARRTSDIAILTSLYNCVTVRLTATEAVRKERGWQFTKGVDDAPSECDLDEYNKWDQLIDTSSSDLKSLEENISTLVTRYTALSKK